MGYSPFRAAPIATPVIPSSARGVSKTRSEPNSCASPSVLPKIPLWSSTPCPNRMTSGFCFSASRMVRNKASRYVTTSPGQAELSCSSACVPVCAVDIRTSLKHVGEQVLPARPRTCFSECDGIINLLKNRGTVPIRQLFIENELIFRLPRLKLRTRAVARMVVFTGPDVLFIAVGLNFHEIGCPMLARMIDDSGKNLTDFHEILPIRHTGDW